MGNPLLSKPGITFFDKTVLPNQDFTIILPRPTSGGFAVKSRVGRSANRVETGATQTSAYYRYDEITYRCDFTNESTTSLFRRLWLSTMARETFVFQRHEALGGVFPDTTFQIHENIWTCRWRIGFDDFLYQLTAGAKGIYSVQLEMEAEAVAVA